MKIPALTAFLLLSLPVSGGAEDLLGEARRHYEAASYEEALSTLGRVADGAGPRVEVEQYRALCLIALGRSADAEGAIAALVAADPLYVPPTSVASPKALALFTEHRRKSLPSVARGLLDTGRAAYTEKRLDQARAAFSLLMRVLDDEVMTEAPEREDLRTLASGFLTLVTASSAPPAPAPPPAELPRAAVAPRVAVTPPAPVSEVFPTWVAPDRLSAAQEYTGTVQLQIGADGRVKSARIQDPSHPAYDTQLVRATRSWVYKPATRNGEAVDSERIITVRLRPSN